MAEGHFIRIEDTGTSRPDLSVDQLWELVHHWHEAWRDAASENVKVRALLSTIENTLSPLDVVGTCKFCGNQDWFDEKGRFVHKPDCPWKQARALLAQMDTGKAE